MRRIAIVLTAAEREKNNDTRDIDVCENFYAVDGTIHFSYNRQSPMINVLLKVMSASMGKWSCQREST